MLMLMLMVVWRLASAHCASEAGALGKNDLSILVVASPTAREHSILLHFQLHTVSMRGKIPVLHSHRIAERAMYHLLMRP